MVNFLCEKKWGVNATSTLPLYMYTPALLSATNHEQPFFRVYMQCTTSRGGEPWCATSVKVYDGKFDGKLDGPFTEWAYCKSECPGGKYRESH